MAFTISQIDDMIRNVQMLKKSAFVPSGMPPGAGPPPPQGGPPPPPGGMPVDPATGAPIDPATGAPMDPAMMGGGPPPPPQGGPPAPLPPDVEAMLSQMTNSMDEVVGFVENLNMAFQKQQQTIGNLEQQIMQITAQMDMLHKSISQPAGFA